VTARSGTPGPLPRWATCTVSDNQMPASPFIDTLFRRLERRDVLADDERLALQAAADGEYVVPAGGDFVREGERPAHSTLVTSGLSIRYRLMPEGERQITAIHVPGDFVDLHSLLLRKMDHAVGALSTCTIVTFPHERLVRITEQYPHLTRLLWLLTVLDAAIHREWIVAMGRRTALQQLAHLICELHARLAAIGLAGDGPFSLPATQADLGDALGLSTVHVNRVLQQLRAERLVSWQGHTVEILDPERLRELASFDEDYLHLEREPR
jgi:CRP-like cAMP-binding protein